ncbi:hypothetical protein CEXT_505241 [Caerostris extrusa]|uniref:Uncharacterized protein n=1 Tax=Caerostris extrusa TaxID=172846 RepID=A0AAV4MRZ0_CAEEX|nr:hypothetical protein CEXT_505241 [Caerostris extrusa]
MVHKKEQTEELQFNRKSSSDLRRLLLSGDWRHELFSETHCFDGNDCGGKKQTKTAALFVVQKRTKDEERT